MTSEQRGSDLSLKVFKIKFSILNVYILPISVLINLNNINIFFNISSGKIDFELIPEREIQDEILKAVSKMDILYMVETSDAFDNLQRILLSILRRYWVPRYFIHLYHTVSSETLSFLKRETPFDIGTLAQQRKLRCQIMFPRIYSASRSSPGSPTTPVFLSSDADRLPEPAYSVTSSDVHVQTPDVEIPSNSSDRNIEPLELLSLWSGKLFYKSTILRFDVALVKEIILIISLLILF